MAEYALLLGLIAVVVSVAILVLREPIVDVFNEAGGVLEGAVGGGDGG